MINFTFLFLSRIFSEFVQITKTICFPLENTEAQKEGKNRPIAPLTDERYFSQGPLPSACCSSHRFAHFKAGSKENFLFCFFCFWYHSMRVSQVMTLWEMFRIAMIIAPCTKVCFIILLFTCWAVFSAKFNTVLKIFVQKAYFILKVLKGRSVWPQVRQRVEWWSPKQIRDTLTPGTHGCDLIGKKGLCRRD